jgi:hypothetical protein
VTKEQTPARQRDRQSQLHELMVVMGVLLLAITAKLGHAILVLMGV